MKCDKHVCMVNPFKFQLVGKQIKDRMCVFDEV